MECFFEYEFPAGKFAIVENEGFIRKIMGVNGKTGIKKETPLIKEAKKQLDEYFSGKRKKFNLPVKIEGTDFQKAVYNCLLEIPYGKTKSYKEIDLKNPKSSLLNFLPKRSIIHHIKLKSTIKISFFLPLKI